MIFLIVFIVLFTKGYVTEAESSRQKNDKRILLSDPDVLQHRVDLLESKLLDLTEQLNRQAESNTGQIGGTWFATTGGAANPLCMAHEVLWGNRASEADGNMAEIHGAEYQDGFWGSGTLDKDAPCAVCKPNKRSTVLMIPGRNKCLSGWFEEYHGYLSANLVGHKHTSTYICVDENVEFLDGGPQNDEGYLLYGVRAHCGSLKCPPYENGRPITCVVCSQ